MSSSNCGRLNHESTQEQALTKEVILPISQRFAPKIADIKKFRLPSPFRGKTSALIGHRNPRSIRRGDSLPITYASAHYSCFEKKWQGSIISNFVTQRRGKLRPSLLTQALKQEVISQIPQRFAPKIPDVEKAIGTLLETESIDCVDGSNDTFTY